MTDLITSLGSGLGSLFGSLASYASTQAGIGAVTSATEAGMGEIQPYLYQGLNFFDPVNTDLRGDSIGSQNIGNQRINAAANPVDFEDFAKNYNTSEGAQYLMKTAAAAQDNSAAARGGLLSGANLRAQTGITEGIANQDLLGQYKAEAAGQQQDFQQRETSYQNMYGQEAMGLQAGIAGAGTAAQGARAIGTLYGQQAANAQASGSSVGGALGSLFGAIGNAFK
jgi:hypothetical protein